MSASTKLSSIVFLSLCGILIWSISCSSYSSHSKPENTQSLRVLQFNIWQEGRSVAGGFEKIVEVILTSKADVIALSEVRNYDGQDLHQRLLAALAARGERFYGTFAGGDVGLLSRWPIRKAESVADETAQDCGSIVAYHLELPQGRRLLVCSAHLDYKNYAIYLPRGYDPNSFKILDANGDGIPEPVTDLARLHAVDRASRRDEALQELVRYIDSKALRNWPCILAGDFNECSHKDWTRDTAQLFSHNGVVIAWQNSRLLEQAGLRDSWRELYPNPVSHPGATWPSEAWHKGSTSWAPAVDERDRIDFVYYRGPGLRAKRAWIVGSRKYYVRNQLETTRSSEAFTLSDLSWPSDHKGLLVDFGF